MGVREHNLAGKLIVAGFLMLFFGLALGTALAKTPTVDEPVHFLRGVVLGQTGDLHLQFEHPPLSHRMIGILLASDGSLPDVRQLPSWPGAERIQIARELVWESGLDVSRLFFLARLPIIWLAILFGALVASWTMSWLGRRAMIVAIVLFASSPNILASASLATTDLAAAALYFATAYIWWRFLEFKKKRCWLMTAVLLGLALSTKLTAVLLLPLLLIQALLYRRNYRSLWRLLLSWAALLLIALPMLWLVYGLEIAPLGGSSLPLPAATYVRSWLNILTHVQEGHQAFFLGELSARGWLTYFPVTFLIKTPLVSLVLLLLGLITITLYSRLWRTSVFLLLPVFTLTAAAMTSGLNIGYRHILPALPFLLILASSSVLILQRLLVTRVLLYVALTWAVISAILHYPDYLAYFNEPAGGTERGYLYLGDSNLDWGQDLQLLASSIAQRGGHWFVSYAGSGSPQYYGLSQEVLLDPELGSAAFAAANPTPGIYAISANHLQGLLPDKDMFDWFRRRQPDANLGGSILIYEVTEQAGGSWIAHCLDPAPLLTPEEAEQLIGHSGLRHFNFDCRQSLVLPDEGEPGWFVLPQNDQWWFLDQLSDEVVAGLHPIYRHNASQFGPSYDVYYWSGNQNRYLLDAPMSAAELISGERVGLPINLDNTLTLTGYQVSNDNWYTEWLVKGSVQEPLSLQAHLYTAENTPPLVGDSLGFSSDQWQPGDRLLQRFEFSGTTMFRYLETAVYNFSTLELKGDALRLMGQEQN